MKKTLSILAVLWATTVVAEDSWLYWMLGDNAPTTGYDTVKVRGLSNNDTENAGYLSLYYPSGDPTGVGDAAYSVARSTAIDMNAEGVGLYAQLATDKSYSSFIIELWNDSQFIAQSDTLSVATAATHIETGNSIGLASAWMPQTYAIPEPNSGLLMLIGCAMLALRRRKAAIA